MRERAISAVVLVPVLLVVLAIGGVVLAAGGRDRHGARRASRSSRLLNGAGQRPLLALGTALALAVVLDAPFPEVLEGSGLLLVAVGIVLVAVARVLRARSARRPRDLDGHGLRRPLRRRSSRSSSASATRRPAVPAGAPLACARARSAAGSCS